ncbi:hypothetical protein [Bradyrhizobium iriomotense]|uniref:Outer membrane protein B n=1 Tax=Bradyrhizobium iriomotense TaxID=441950 RepID=A0ABQ6AZV3_9BRAD|nr:hypothetical protein [Bradyrhizobium iriomotense]GLR85433.1 outer membrane protein B [Bradyrhizobium iriomotense]
MRRIAWLAMAVALLLPVFASAPAHAQATRTWVSGVGDDANPCSRTAPCKTFAGAISKTAAAGEINCLDPGGFGAVTITKSITISCEAGTAGVLVSGTNGIVINAATTDFIYLKGLDIEGLGTGLVGIKFFTGAGLVVDNCVIRGFQAGSALAIGFNPTSNATLTVTNTVIAKNGISGTGGGIQVAPGNGTATANAMLSHVTLEKNNVGVASVGAGAASNVQIYESTINGSLNTGIVAAGTGGVVRIGRSAITGSGGAATSGNVLSYLDNQINGNNPDTTPGTAGGYH